MLRPWQFWLLTLLALAVAGVFATNMVYFDGNRKLQAEVNGRAQHLQQTAQLEQLAREVAAALAQLSVRNNDARVREMLGALGIAVSAPPAAAPSTPGGRK